VWYRGTTARSLTVRRSMALSPVDGRRAPGNRWPPQNSCWTSDASSKQGDEPAATSGASAIHPRSPTHRMVHQKTLEEDHRHKDGAPVSK
jgi:hypothetical protein